MGFTVPVKKLAKASDRNLIKRRLREAYRQNKYELINYLKKNGTKIDVIFIYSSNKLLMYKDIEEKIILSLNRLKKESEKIAK